jgi:hypothetical protein
MKVLKEGHWPDPKQWTQEIDCPHCRSKLEVGTGDIGYRSETGGNPHDYCPETYTTKCGFCNNGITLSGNSMPRSVRKSLGSHK